MCTAKYKYRSADQQNSCQGLYDKNKLLNFKFLSQMKKLNISQMENLQGNGLPPKCLASMGLSGVACSMIAGPWGYAIGAAGAYFWNPDC